MNPTLLPYAIALTALHLGMALQPYTLSGMDWLAPLSQLPARLTVSEGTWLSYLLAIPLGFAWQGVLRPRTSAERVATTVTLLLGIGLYLAVLGYLQILYAPTRVPSHGGLMPMLGCLTGMTLEWGEKTRFHKISWSRPAFTAVTAMTMAAPLLPLDFASALYLPALPSGVADYFSDLPHRYYSLIKSALLWVPVGFIYTVLGPRHNLPGWAMALLLAFVLEGLPWLGDLPLGESLELPYALPGLWFGAWLAKHDLLAWGDARNRATDTHQSISREPTIHPRPAVASQTKTDKKPAIQSANTVLPPAAVTGPTTHHTVKHSRMTAQPLRLLVGGLALLASAVGLAGFPLWQTGIALSFLAYVTLLWLRPNAWLVVVPATLPLLDLAPWTGRFFLDEFDLVMLVTAGTLYLRGRRWPGLGLTPLWPLLTLFGASLLVSLLLGLGSPPPLDANAFSSYWSGYNSLRVAKGFIWGGLIFLLLRLSRPQPAQLARLLSIGIGIGLLGVGLVGLWERWLFAGFADSNHTYRIVSTFSSMHTGGGHIEAYLAAALPFLWLGLSHWRSALLALPVMLLTMYVTVFTVARGGVLALGVVLVVLTGASLRQSWRSGRRMQAAIPVSVMAVLAAVLLVGIGGGYFQQRLAQTGEDWQIRMNHWQLALGMMDSTPMAQMFGMGLGSFPRVYLERGPADKQSATYGFTSEGGNNYLRLGTGDTVYYAQRVAVRAGESYHLELEVRSATAAARVSVPVCEKQLLNSRNCVWNEFTVPGDGRWHRLTRDFSSGEVGVEDGLKRPPVELYLHHPGQGSVVDIDNLRLLDSRGNNLLGNGGFSMGGDYWFFKTHSHLPWHIKNFWVHLLFEQGWVGLLLFTSLILFALARLGRMAWRGQPLAWVWLASLLGMLTVGMFDSLVDTPRLATLLVAFSLLGAGHDWTDPGRPLRRRRGSARTASADAGRGGDPGS